MKKTVACLTAAILGLAVSPAMGHTVTCNGATLSHGEHGTTGNDSPTLSGAADRYHGLEGDDTIDGLGGADVLCGGPGVDSITGGNGGDDINAGDSADSLVAGGDAVDYLHAGDNSDLLHGGDNGDILGADAGQDDSYGQAGGDDIFPGVPGSGGAHDLVSGGSGEDTLWACLDTSGTEQDSLVDEPVGDLMEHRFLFTQASDPAVWAEFCGLGS